MLATAIGWDVQSVGQAGRQTDRQSGLYFYKLSIAEDRS